MGRPLPEKLGINHRMRAFFVNAPPDVLDLLAAADLTIAAELTDFVDYIHVFTTSQAQLADHVSRLKDQLTPTAMVWISWPKHRQRGTDLTLPTIIKIGYDYGLVESTCISVDATWSAIKFTRPIPGKVYTNRYGTLKQ